MRPATYLARELYGTVFRVRAPSAHGYKYPACRRVVNGALPVNQLATGNSKGEVVGGLKSICAPLTFRRGPVTGCHSLVSWDDRCLQSVILYIAQDIR